MSSAHPLRGSVAIVGLGETPVGALPDRGSTELSAEALRLALADAGIGKTDFDGLITCNPWVEPHLYHAEMFSEYLQVFPRFCMTLNAGGATTLTAVMRAASATRLCRLNLHRQFPPSVNAHKQTTSRKMRQQPG